jgi:iron complex outermembrane receptor protein
MKNLCLFLFFGIFFLNVSAQDNNILQDSTNLERLDQVLVKAVRVEADSPITHSNITKEELAQRNLGQDLPILLNYLPSVVTTTDAGA